MIEWQSFVLVAVVSLVAASVVVTIAAIGIRLVEGAQHARSEHPARARRAVVASRILFGICGLVVLFGVYLIVPALH